MSLIVRKPNLWPNMSLTCGCLLFGSDWRSLILTQLYDEIGIGYRDYRRPDSRIYTTILRSLGEARAIVNVGAGIGSYEPVSRSVVAVEPSLAMSVTVSLKALQSCKGPPQTSRSETEFLTRR